METVGALVVQIAVIGCVYTLIAAAFNLVFATSRIVNFAQGDFVAAGGVIVAVLAVSLGLPFGIAVLAGTVAIAAAGLLAIRFLVLPTLPGIMQRSVPETNQMRWVLSTIGVSVTLEAVGTMLTPQGAIGVAPFVPGAMQIGPVHVPAYDAVLVAIALATMLGLHLLLQRTVVGQTLRAVAADRYGAAAIGIPIDRVVTLTFVGAAVLSALAGVLILPVTQANASNGFALGLAGFASATVGGLGDMRGAIWGGAIVAAAELLGTRFVNSQMEAVFPLLVMIAVLLVRPQGLFGGTLVERV